jgi:DNA-binding transcriptional LysR family regulator
MKPKLNLEALVVLDVIARRSSFAAAAEELHRVPSSITYTIKRLEENLGVTLFDRQGHRAQLTPAGKALLNEGRTLLSLAEGIEHTIQQIATGWEAELRIAIDDIIPYDKVLDLCERFYQFSPHTQLSLTTEILGGTWDAIISGRADLLIGATGEGPAGGGYTRRHLGDIDFIFVVAPHHPLAKEEEPLSNGLIRQHRAIAAADSSRQLSPKTTGLLVGQPVLTVPNLAMKFQAQIKGLGVGYLPRHMVEDALLQGTLIRKRTEDEGNTLHSLSYVWPTRHKGKGLSWFKDHLCEENAEINWFSH